MDGAYDEDVNRAFPLSAPGAHRLVKGTETPRSANRSRDDKRAAAISHASSLTWIGDAGDIEGPIHSILLVDDVLSSGSQRRHVALGLRAARATDVRGLALTRVPWSG
ncbi:hypothetical protein [Streptomyces sp. NPDC057002]|uniref:hypothetical protein n=1 Tax=Streptomyces sp. NPDC057002 TaxID=3345992 RepID=UPI0036258CF9